MFRIIMPVLVAVFAIAISSQALAQGGFGEADANDDKKVDAKELKTYVSGKLQDFEKFDELFKTLDKDDDKGISEDEFANRMEAVQSVMGGGGGQQEQRPRPPQRPESLKVGQDAPTFTLKSLDGESQTDLAEFKEKKPVVLIFGSYT